MTEDSSLCIYSCREVQGNNRKDKGKYKRVKSVQGLQSGIGDMDQFLNKRLFNQ